MFPGHELQTLGSSSNDPLPGGRVSPVSQELSSLFLGLTPLDRVHTTPRLPAPANSKPSTKHFSSRGASCFCRDPCPRAPSPACCVFSFTLGFQLCVHAGNFRLCLVSHAIFRIGEELTSMEANICDAD